MSPQESEKGANSDLSDSTGALLMLNKAERKLIKELLQMALNSDKVKSYIIERLGKSSIQTGEALLKTLEGP